jgi:transposase
VLLAIRLDIISRSNNHNVFFCRRGLFILSQTPCVTIIAASINYYKSTVCGKLKVVAYQRYPSKFKEAILSKLSQSGLSVRKFAEQEGLNLSSLCSWQKQFNRSGLNMSKVSLSDKWSSEEKFAVVLEISTLSAVELNKYCRVKGLYLEQIKVWKQACIARKTTTKQTKRVKATPEKKIDKNRIKALKHQSVSFRWRICRR